MNGLNKGISIMSIQIKIKSNQIFQQDKAKVRPFFEIVNQHTWIQIPIKWKNKSVESKKQEKEGMNGNKTKERIKISTKLTKIA